jgi:hypothetical protein
MPILQIHMPILQIVKTITLCGMCQVYRPWTPSDCPDQNYSAQAHPPNASQEHYHAQWPALGMINSL